MGVLKQFAQAIAIAIGVLHSVELPAASEFFSHQLSNSAVLSSQAMDQNPVAIHANTLAAASQGKMTAQIDIAENIELISFVLTHYVNTHYYIWDHIRHCTL